MRKRIALRDFIIRATDASRDDVMRCVRYRLGLCLQHSSHVASLVLLVILAVPLLARTNAAVPDPGSTLFEIPSRQYLFGDRGGKRSKLAEKGVTFDFFSISRELSRRETFPALHLSRSWPIIYRAAL